MSAGRERSGRLVADVGGTNTRIALVDGNDHQLHALRRYRNCDFDGLEAVLSRWLEDCPDARPREACIAVAAPPDGDTAIMSNCNWSFSGSALATHFGWARVGLINDFQANAFALPWLQTADWHEIHPGDAAYPRLATLGPGTGLGGAVLDTGIVPHRAVACEPGQMTLAPEGLLALELWRVLMSQHGRIYTELLLSGPGLQRLYQALAAVRGVSAEPLSSEAISARALAGTDTLCTATLHQFCALLGSASADFVLANGAFGGLYLAGGIVSAFPEFLGQSEFYLHFISRGPMQGHLQRMPVRVITHPFPGLVGAARAALP
jgi:glucokinase